MDKRLRVSEEHSGFCGDFDGHFLQIVDLKPAHLDTDYFKDSCVLLWEAYYHIQDVDLMEEVELPTVKKKITKAEAKVWQYFSEGCKLNLAYFNGVACGITVWQPVFHGVATMRILYVKPEYRAYKIGQTLGGICEAQRFLYQTLKKKEPEAMMKHCLKFSEKLFEDDTTTTYLMKWERD